MAQTYTWPSLTLDTSEDLAVLREQARQQGYEDGYQAGNRTAQEEIAELRQSLADSIARLPELERQIEQEDSTRLLDLIRHISQSLLGVELKTNPDVVQSLVAEGLVALNAERTSVELVIAPEDEHWLVVEGIHTVVSENQPAGSVMLRSPVASVEFDPVTRLAELLESVDAAG